MLEQDAPLLSPIDPPEALGATLASRLHNVPELDAVLHRYSPALPRPRLEPAWPLPDRPDPATPCRAQRRDNQLRILSGRCLAGHQ
ncbi:MAG: hypothetical protein M3460_21365 [Actinomycetota bacterium]|nr:hypothetical protein [Actinomycetota bacterium]